MNAATKSPSVSRPGHDHTGSTTAHESAGAPILTGHVLVLFALILATVLAIYQPAWHGGMLWDDDAHITRTGFRSLEGLRRIWLEPRATQQYYPLAHSAFWIEHRLWGDETLGYHLVNIVLHGLSAFLFFLILRRLIVPAAVLAAFAFALHPVHVESVAWISELKNTLSGVFYLGAALAYLHFDGARRALAYVSALALFVLALLAKTVTATLPLSLLIVFWWQRGTVSLRRDVAPLLPFVALGGAAGALTTWIERTVIGAQGAEFNFTAVERCLIAGRAVWFYLGKLLWPANLIFTYPRWSISGGVWWQYLYPVGLVAVIAALWLTRSRSRAPLAALLLFCVALLPVLGFLNVFPFRFSFVADHFQYLASLPIIALAASAITVLSRRTRAGPAGAVVALVAVCLPLGILTWRQSHHYTDAETLLRATIARNPASWMAHNNLGMLKLDLMPQEAVAHLREALRLKPDLAEAHCSLGAALYRLGRREEAMAEYREAARLKPELPEVHNNLCDAFRQAGRLQDAATACLEAIRLRPDFVDAQINLAIVLFSMGGFERAKAHLEVAIELDPARSEAHYYLGLTLGRLGRFEEARGHLEETVRLSPSLAEAHNYLGVAVESLGRRDEAARHYGEALRLKPDLEAAKANLARVQRVPQR